jgi:methylase of polypeptide subunit release factors
MDNLLSASVHAAKESQAERLKERKTAASKHVTACGRDFIVDRGVYDTSVDTELMAETVRLGAGESFLEIGCGSGAVSLLLAGKCTRGVATDINPLAVANARQNAEHMGIANVDFVVGDGYAGIKDKFDVLICNPPYNNCPAGDAIERMFWDPDDGLKNIFFEKAEEHLLPHGRIYFGWADFGDIDVGLPLKLAEKYGLTLVHTSERPSHSGRYRFFVLEFRILETQG